MDGRQSPGFDVDSESFPSSRGSTMSRNTRTGDPTASLSTPALQAVVRRFARSHPANSTSKLPPISSASPPPQTRGSSDDLGTSFRKLGGTRDRPSAPIDEVEEAMAVLNPKSTRVPFQPSITVYHRHNTPPVEFGASTRSRTGRRQRALTADTWSGTRKGKGPDSDADSSCGDPEEELLALDPIAYFAKHRNDPVRFVYLNQVPAGPRELFNPYNLVVVAFKDLNKEYFTMSPKGITHIRRDGYSEFTPLAQWVREATLFKVISQLPVFRNYRYWKNFRKWLSFVRTRRIKAHRVQLQHRLLPHRPVFRSFLHELAKLLEQELLSTDIIPVKMKAAYTVSEFTNGQISQRRYVKETLGELMEQVVDLIERMCSEVCDPERLRIPEEEFKLKARRKVSMRQLMLLEKQKTAEMARITKEVNLEVKLIGNFIRMADYMVVEYLIRLVLDKMTELRDILAVEKATVFTTEVVFSDAGEIRFNPSEARVTEMLLNSTDQAVSLLNSLPRVVHHEQFRQYLQHSGKVPSEWHNVPSVKDALPHVEIYQQVRDQICTQISASFADAAEFASMFKNFAPIFAFGTSWSIDVYRERTPDLDEFANDLMKFRTWQRDLEQIQPSSTRGILFVDSKALKSALSPIPERAMTDLKTVLMERAAERSLRLLTLFRDSIKNLALEPTSLDEFVEFLRFLAPLPAKSQECIREAQMIDDMYVLLDEYHAVVSSAEVERHSLIHTVFGRFRSSLEQAEGTRTEHLPRYVDALTEKVTANRAALAAVVERLGADVFANTYSVAKSLLIDLSDIRQQLEAVYDLAKKYDDYQLVLGMNPEPLDAIEGSLEVLRLTEALWESVHFWQRLTEMFNTTPFVSLSHDTLSTELSGIAERVNQLGVQMEECADPLIERRTTVLRALSDKVDGYMRILPRILQLANPAMRSRHWARLFEAVNQPFDEETVFSLSQLREYGILAQKVLVHDVSSLATGEDRLETALERITKYWEGMELNLVSYHETSRKALLLSGVPTLLAQLEDHELQLGQMLDSEYVSGIAESVTNLKGQLARVSEILELWSSCQQRWTYLEPIFAQYEVQRSLSSLTTKFRVVDRRWRSVMRSTHREAHVLQATSTPGLGDTLSEANRVMDQILRNLDAFLDTKRRVSPRLFLLSDDDMFFLISRVRSAEGLAPLLAKCFPNVAKLRTEPHKGLPRVVNVVGEEGEAFRLTSPVVLEPPAETWISSIGDSIQKTLHFMLARSLVEYNRVPLLTWVRKYPTQVALSVMLIAWTRNIHLSLEKDDPAPHLRTNEQFIRSRIRQVADLLHAHEVRREGTGRAGAELLTVLEAPRGLSGEEDAEREPQIEEKPRGLVKSLSRTDSSIAVKGRRGADAVTPGSPASETPKTSAEDSGTLLTALRSMLTLDLYCARMTRTLLEKRVSSVQHPDWTRQLRFFWDEKKHVAFVKQGTMVAPYGYEFVGPSRLAMTPSLAATQFALTQSVSSGIGSSLIGTHGSGKGSAVYDLARALGRMYLGFECSPVFSARALIRLLTGVVQLGAWLCLEHLQVVKPELLSVVIQSLRAPSLAVVERAESVQLDGKSVPVGSTLAVFATFGHSPTCAAPKISASLLQYMRPVAVAAPDRHALLELLLLSHGFRNPGRRVSRQLALVLETLSRGVLRHKAELLGSRLASRLVKVAADVLAGLYPGMNPLVNPPLDAEAELAAGLSSSSIDISILSSPPSSSDGSRSHGGRQSKSRGGTRGVSTVGSGDAAHFGGGRNNLKSLMTDQLLTLNRESAAIAAALALCVLPQLPESEHSPLASVAEAIFPTYSAAAEAWSAQARFSGDVHVSWPSDQLRVSEPVPATAADILNENESVESELNEDELLDNIDEEGVDADGDGDGDGGEIAKGDLSNSEIDLSMSEERRNVVRAAMSARSLPVVESMVDKVLELDDALCSYTCVAVQGRCLSGKSTMIELAAACHSRLTAMRPKPARPQTADSDEAVLKEPPALPPPSVSEVKLSRFFTSALVPEFLFGSAGLDDKHPSVLGEMFASSLKQDAETVLRWKEDCNAPRKPRSAGLDGTAGGADDLDASASAPPTANDRYGALSCQWVVLDGLFEQHASGWASSLRSLCARASTTVSADDFDPVCVGSSMLCTGGGERIPMPAQARMIIELDDETGLPPALQSRIPVVQATLDTVPVEAVLAHWLQVAREWMPHSVYPNYSKWLPAHVPAAIAYVQSLLTSDTFRLPAVSVARSFTDILEKLTREHMMEEEGRLEQISSFLVTFALAWGVGGSLDTSSRQLFDSWLREHVTPDVGGPALPSFLTIFDHGFRTSKKASSSAPSAGRGTSLASSMSTMLTDFASTARASDGDSVPDAHVPWSKLVPPHRTPALRVTTPSIVPTTETVSFTYVIERLLAAGRPVLLIGEAGTGKSAISEAVAKKADDSFLVKIDCSRYTQANTVSGVVAAQFEKKLRNVLGSPGGQRALFIFDGLGDTAASSMGLNFSAAGVTENEPGLSDADRALAAAERAGTFTGMCEMLRQLLETGNMFIPSRQKVMRLSNCAFLASSACSPAGITRLPRRLLARFHVLRVPPVSAERVSAIVSPMLKSFLLPLSKPQAVRLVEPLVDATLRVHSAACRLFGKPGIATAEEDYSGYQSTRSSLSVGDVDSSVDKDEERAPIDKSDSSDRAVGEAAPPHYRVGSWQVVQVVRGMLHLQRDHVSAPALAAVWAHECRRVYVDRLSDAHKSVILAEISETLTSMQARELITPAMINTEKDAIRKGGIGTVLFADIGGSGYVPALRQELHSQLSLLMDPSSDARERGAGMFPTPSAVEHFSRLLRVIRQPRGHALLIGAGAGRAAVAHSVASLASVNMFSLSLRSTTTDNEVATSLRSILLSAGTPDCPVALFVRVERNARLRHLSTIDSLVRSGRAPGLLDTCTDQVVQEVRLSALADGCPSTTEAIMQYFYDNVSNNLHVFVALDPAKHGYAAQLGACPSLLRLSAVDVFDDFDVSQMHALSASVLADAPEALAACADRLGSLATKIHLSAAAATKALRVAGWEDRGRGGSFMKLLSLVTSLFAKKYRELKHKRSSLQTGLQKFELIHQIVENTQTELDSLRPLLAKIHDDTTRLQEAIAKNSRTVQDFWKDVHNEEMSVSVKDSEAAMMEAEARAAEEEFEAVMPQVREAKAALSRVRLIELKNLAGSLDVAPDRVLKVLECIAILRGSDTSLTSLEATLQESRLVAWMADFEPGSVGQTSLDRLKKYLINPEFTPEGMQPHSIALLCSWVIAVERGATVYKETEPKRRNIQQTTSTLKESQASLREKQQALAMVEEKLEQFKKVYAASLEKKERLEEKAGVYKTRLERARKLLGALQGEQSQWEAQTATLQKDQDSLPANCLIAAAFLVYLGPFSATHRKKMLAHWKSLAEALGFSQKSWFSTDLLVDASTVRNWQKQGLPSDEQSVENAVLTTTSTMYRWPLLIDPDGVAVRWLNNAERAGQLKVLPELPTDSRDLAFEHAIAVACAAGRPVLLPDITRDPPSSLFNLLSGDRSPSQVLVIGDESVKFNPAFRLYLSTRVSDLSCFSSEFLRTVNVVDFTSTKRASEELLLMHVMRQERSDIQQQRESLTDRRSADLAELKDRESQILELLATSSGDVLENIELVETLDSAKATIRAVNKRLVNAGTQARKLADTIRRYVGIAQRAATLYDVVTRVSRLSPSYTSSLAAFVHSFKETMIKAPAAPDVAARVQVVNEQLSASVFSDTVRMLRPEHRLVFAFALSSRVLAAEGDVTEEDWWMFVHGQHSATALGDPVDFGRVPKKPSGEWPSSETWDRVLQLNLLMPGIARSVSSNTAEWQEWCEAPDSSENPIPSGWEESASDFQQLVLLRVLAPQRLVSGVQAFVRRQLGPLFNNLKPADLAGAVAASSPSVPIVMLSPDMSESSVDPAALLSAIAHAHGKGDRLHVVSLGSAATEMPSALVVAGEEADLAPFSVAESDPSGQPKRGFAARQPMAGADFAAQRTEPTRVGALDAALAVVKRCIDQGHWVLILDAHHAPGWLHHVEELLSSSQANPSSDFRCFIAADASKPLPHSLLHRAVRVSMHLSDSIRDHVMHTFRFLPESVFANSKKSGHLRRLAYTLSVAHALIAVRSSYGIQGYARSPRALAAVVVEGIRQVRLMLDQAELRARPVPYTKLRQVLNDAFFNGLFSSSTPMDAMQSRSMVTDLVSPQVMDETYVLNGDDSYKMPPEGADVSSFFATLPMVDSAAVAQIGESRPPSALQFLADVRCMDVERYSDSASLASVPELSRVLETPGSEAMSAFARASTPATDAVAEPTTAAAAESATPDGASAVESEAIDASTSEQVSNESVLEPSVATVAAVYGMRLRNATLDAAVARIQRLPEPLDDEKALAKKAGLFLVSLKNEIASANYLLSRAKEDVALIGLCVRRGVPLPPHLQSVRKTLARGGVPTVWLSERLDSCTHSSFADGIHAWLDKLVARMEFLQLWLRSDSHPNSYFFPAFSSPATLILAVMQSAATRMNENIEDLVPVFEIGANLSKKDMKTGRGILLSGLRLVGAAWDPVENILIEPTSSASGEDPGEPHLLPGVVLRCIRAEEVSHSIWLPLYLVNTAGEITEEVVRVAVPTKKPRYWLRRGVKIVS